MSKSTALLTTINIKNNQKSYGKNTKDALNAGFIWGYDGLINNIINKITLNWKKNKIILTGGYANLFKKIIKKKTFIDQNITIKGISKSIHEIFMSKEELLFCPLGGRGEIGGEYEFIRLWKENDQKWIIVDMGVSFADDSVPGIDLILPNAGFIIDKKDDLLGIVLTHAHEDHIGAVAHLWPELKCKMYATPFTAALVLEKFKEKRIDISSYLEVVPLNSKIKLGVLKLILLL